MKTLSVESSVSEKWYTAVCDVFHKKTFPELINYLGNWKLFSLCKIQHNPVKDGSFWHFIIFLWFFKRKQSKGKLSFIVWNCLELQIVWNLFWSVKNNFKIFLKHEKLLSKPVLKSFSTFWGYPVFNKVKKRMFGDNSSIFPNHDFLY